MAGPRLVEEIRHRIHDVIHNGDLYFSEIAVDIAVFTSAAEQSVYHRKGYRVGYLNDNVGLADLLVLDTHVHHAHQDVIRKRVVELAVPLLLDVHQRNAAVQSEQTCEVRREKSRIVLEYTVENLDLFLCELLRSAEVVLLDLFFLFLRHLRNCAGSDVFKHFIYLRLRQDVSHLYPPITLPAPTASGFPLDQLLLSASVVIMNVS
jgi:hypothetical protein